MDEWPIVSVLIVTFYRPEEIRRTVRTLIDKIQYAPDRLRWHIADDSSDSWNGGDPNFPPETYILDIQHEFPDQKFTATITDRQGWGANVNKGMLYCWDHYGPYIFLCEDDYIARHDVRLREGIAILEWDQDIGLIRYDGIEGHKLDLELRECDTRLGKVPRLRILKQSPFLNVYSNRPHLKHQRFHDVYDMYPVGLPLADTETRFAQTVKRNPGPHVAVLKDGIVKAFDHIGKSRQGTEHDLKG